MSLVTTLYRFLVRGGTAANLAAVNETPLARELIVATDTRQMKLGDGSTAYNSLPFINTDSIPEGASLYFTDERAQDAVAAMIAAGTHTGITFTYGDAGNSLSASVSGGGGSGNLVYVATATVAGSAATTLTMSGLDLAADGCYLIHLTLKNNNASLADVSMYFNSDTTATNYWIQAITANNTANNSVRANVGAIATMEASIGIYAEVSLKRDFDGYPRALARNTRGSITAPQLQLIAHGRNNTANVTSITLSASVANALAVGSKFDVYKVEP